MRVLIVDDEPAARTRLLRLLEELDIEVAGEAANGLEALEQLARLRPDVVLLDIDMPEITGLDVARRLPDPPALVVFQTAYDEYALAAFEREAIDYLLKPVTKDRLAESLARAARRLDERTGRTPITPELAGRLDAVLRRAGPQPRPRRILVRYRHGHRLLPVSDVDRFAAGDGVVSAHTRQSTHLIDDTLDELERRLAGAFVRVSRADLIAIDRVDFIASNGDGSLTLTLKDGAAVRVSRRRAAAVRATFERA
jgi:DNA-binding LytR/AlgR family response regulator